MDINPNQSVLSFYCDRIQRNGWEEVILRDETTGFSATIIPSAGGILNSLITTQDGKQIQLIDGFKDAADWKENCTNGFKSAKLSPFACRLNKSTYSWQGKEYVIEKFKLEGHAIHGILFDAPHEIMIAEASAFMAECKLLYRYKGTDPGFPFSFDMNIRYRLEGANRLTIITTVHNRSGQTIPICDGWHPYFKLGDSIDTARLQFNSKKELEFNTLLMPTGKITKNKKWFKGAPLKDVKMDNIFLLDLKEPMPHCILSDEAMRLAIYMYPDEAYPYLLIYTPEGRKSIAIESHSAPPDAFNNKMGLIELGPEDSKAFTTKYRIASIEPEVAVKKRTWFNNLFSKRG